MTSENFSTLVQGLIAAAQLDISPGENLARLSFDCEDVVCHVVPHPDEDRVLVEAVLCRLDEVPASLTERLCQLLLHLNTAARFGHQAVASLSVDDDILVSRVLDTTSLDGERLAAEMMLVIDAATSLRKAIEELCHEEGEEQAEPAFFSPEERA